MIEYCHEIERKNSMGKPYENYKIAPGEFIDPDERFIYIEDADPTSSGYRRAVVKDSVSGEQFECSFFTLRSGQAKTPSEKKESYHQSAINKTKYRKGDVIGKYHDILILDLDAEKYPPKIRKGGKTDRCGLFRNLVTGEEFVSTLNSAITRSSNKVTSLGEKRIEEIFEQYDIAYESQKTYDDLTGFVGGKSMAFDFYLPKERMLIEYDGVQHLLSHHDEKMFHSTEEERYIYYARDIMKEAWCHTHAVPLLRLSNVPIDELQYEMLISNIKRAISNAKNGNYVSFYPELSEKEYESVSVTMSHLDARYQYDFYRHMRDTCIDYRRPNDLPIEEDKALLLALPSGTVPPVLFSEPKPRSFYKKKRVPIIIGDVIGNNGVKYISDFDDNGNKIESPKWRRRALFECPCGNHFISTFTSVRGSKSNGYEGKLCDECSKKRRQEKMAETRSKCPSLQSRQYKAGEYVDPDEKFRFVEEVPSNTPGERRIIVIDDGDNQFTFNLSYLRSGKAKTKAERDEQKKEKAYRKISKGDVIGVDKCLVAQHDVEYYTYDDYSKISIDVYNTLTYKYYKIKLSTALMSHTTGTSGAAVHQKGETVGKAGVTFLEWCDEHGMPVKTDKKEGIVSKYARFCCSCEKHNEFVAEWKKVRDGKRQCPECMEHREKESRRKNGLSHRLNFALGDPIDPNGRYLYVSEDTKTLTKKRKVIVRDSVTDEEFSCLYDKVRQGDIVPPSEKIVNKSNGYKKMRKYEIGDLVGKDDNIRIVGEMEPFKASNGNLTRKFIFRNLKTGKLFDNSIDDVVKGRITGARSKKTEEDYDGYDILSEDDAKDIKPKVADNRHEQWKNLTKEELTSLINEMSSSKIAERYGVSFQTVCRRLNKLGIDNPNK